MKHLSIHVFILMFIMHSLPLYSYQLHNRVPGFVQINGIGFKDIDAVEGMPAIPQPGTPQKKIYDELMITPNLDDAETFDNSITTIILLIDKKCYSASLPADQLTDNTELELTQQTTTPTDQSFLQTTSSNAPTYTIKSIDEQNASKQKPISVTLQEQNCPSQPGSQKQIHIPGAPHMSLAMPSLNIDEK
jgi:hypothetical protein